MEEKIVFVTLVVPKRVLVYKKQTNDLSNGSRLILSADYLHIGDQHVPVADHFQHSHV